MITVYEDHLYYPIGCHNQKVFLYILFQKTVVKHPALYLLSFSNVCECACPCPYLYVYIYLNLRIY